MNSELINQGPSEMVGLFEDILDRGLSLRVKVTGRSMIPFLKGGEILTIRQETYLSLCKGDLILFRSTFDLPVLHRIIRIRKDDDGALWFLTKGDALMAFDDEIHQSSVLGKVCEIKKYGASGKLSQINMNSLFYRCVNFSISVLGFFKTRTCFFLSGAVLKRT
jgi:signal peptidase I